MFPLYDNIPTRRTPLVVYMLVAINVLAFLWVGRLPDWEQQKLAYQYGFVPARIQQLREPYPLVVPMNVVVHIPFWGNQVVQQPIELPPAPRQIVLSLLTCMFLHGGWAHLLGNMWFLLLFGNNVEDRLGPVRFLILYLVGGLIASAVHWRASPSSVVPVIGASGAIAAVLGAYAVTWPWARVSTLVFLVFFVTIIDIPALVVLGAWFLVQVLESTRGEASAGVAWWAHVGGFVAGVALMPLLSWTIFSFPPEEESAVE
ncbi:MAG: rhomboid family intramembrane serine protease [Thermoguttaceae bacterium]